MKTIAKIITVAVFVLGAQVSHGSNPDPTISVRVLDETSFALYMEHIENQKLRISIKNEEGETLYWKGIRNKGSFTRKLNLKELKAGEYSLEIKDNIGIMSYPIKLSHESLIIPTDERVATFNPIIRQTKNTVSLLLFSPALHQHELSIYDDNNEIIHTETITETANYKKKFDFSEAAPGAYSIVINSQGHEYTYMMPVK